MTTFEELTLLISAVSAIAALWAAVLLLRQIRTNLNSTFYSEYTARYQKIMMGLPHQMILDRLKLEAVDGEDRERVVGLLRAYIDLCAEEHFLWTTGRLARDVWRHWLGGIVDNFKIKALLEVWDEVATQRDYAQLRGFLQHKGIG